MLVYVITAIMLALIATNYFLGAKLFLYPSDPNFYNNVNGIDLSARREIRAKPTYVAFISAVTGILIGLYLAYANVQKVDNFIVPAMTVIIFICYLIEITRKISLKDGIMTLGKFGSKPVAIDMRRITGIYIYSYTKKFLNKHAFTTKLVIIEDTGTKTKFTLSSLDNKAVLNMMKDTFGVKKNKMFILKKTEKVTEN